MLHGLARSVPPIPRPAPSSGKILISPNAQTSHVRNRTPLQTTYGAHVSSNTSNFQQFRRNADNWSGNGPVRRVNRKRHSSPPLPQRSAGAVSRDVQARNANHESVHTTITSVTNSYGLTRCEFEFCRRTLRSVFQQCTDDEFARLSIIISCLLTCFRSLHVSEVSAILVILLGKDFGDEASGISEEAPAVVSLQVKYSQLLCLDTSGDLRFAHPLLPRFLLACPIRGIDRSHVPLAKACLIQMETATQTAESYGPSIASLMDGHTESAETSQFSAYAAANWQKHYRVVEAICPGATAIVHRTLWKMAMSRSPCSKCNFCCPDFMAGATRDVMQFCISSQFKVLGAHYVRQLKELAEATYQSASRDRCRFGATSQSHTPELEIDHKLAELGLEDSGSEDSDGWSFV